MKFAAVQILKILFQLARRIHVFEIGKQVHVTERIDRDKREIWCALAEMVQWMSETVAIGNEEVYVGWNWSQKKMLIIVFFIRNQTVYSHLSPINSLSTMAL